MATPFHVDSSIVACYNTTNNQLSRFTRTFPIMSNALNHRALLIAAIALCAVAFSCIRDKDAGGKVRSDLPLERLHDGDLVFRCGVGATSQVVSTLDNGNSTYTHIGIAINRNGKWQVIHAVPGESHNGVDRVKVEPIDSFFLTTRAEHGAVMRLNDCSDTTARRAACTALQFAHKGVEFDNRYNWNDHSRLYCTELVQVAYESAGVDLTGNRMSNIKLPFFKGKIVFPSDIVRNDSLTTVFAF